MSDKSMDVDAAPEPPRQNVERQPDVSQLLQTDTQVPTADWAFKNFLVKLAKEMTDGDLEEMKFVFSGDGGIGKAALSKVKTPLGLFTLLETRRWLTRDNLFRLQAALKTMGRKDLIKDAAAYAQQTDNVLHFYLASDQPENGYRHVKLHIRGLNFENASRDDIHLIRMKLAELVFAPVDCIILDGIEPSTSLILTFQLPELYVKLLLEMLDTDECKSCLKAIGIDVIEVQDVDKLIRLSDTEEKSTLGIREEHEKLYNIYQQLENVKKQLEDTEIKCIDLQNCLDKETFELKALQKTMEVKSKPPMEDDKKKEALMEFEKHLRQPEIASYGKELILPLLDANARLVATVVSESRTLMEEKLQLVIKEMREQMLPLQLELVKFRAFSSQDSIDRMILENLRKLQQTVSVEQVVSVQIDDQLLQILKKISNGLRQREREKLEGLYTWTSNEELKQVMNNNSSLFLAGILHKEIQKRQRLVDTETFIPQCLEVARRPDLKKKFQSLCSALKKERSGPTSDRSRQRSKSLERKDDTGITINHDLVKTMADQIDKMYNIIVPAHEAYSGSNTFPSKCASNPFDIGSVVN